MYLGGSGFAIVYDCLNIRNGARQQRMKGCEIYIFIGAGIVGLIRRQRNSFILNDILQMLRLQRLSIEISESKTQ